MDNDNCWECGAEMVPFDGGVFVVKHGGERTEVAGLSGWRCEACGEVEFTAESAQRYAAGGDALILSARWSAAIGNFGLTGRTQ